MVYRRRMFLRKLNFFQWTDAYLHQERYSYYNSCKMNLYAGLKVIWWKIHRRKMLSVRQRTAKYINNCRKIQFLSRYYPSIYLCLVNANLLGVRVRTQTVAISSDGRGKPWNTLPRSEHGSLPLSYPLAYASSDVINRATANIICTIILLLKI